jgi:hypothetical protein
MIRVVLFALALAIPSFSFEQAAADPFRNRISVGLDGHLRYERTLPFGFRIGTDWKYRFLVEGNRFLHMDQQPELWLFTVAHGLNLRFADWENRLSVLGAPDNRNGLKYDTGIRKNFVIEERWALSPFVSIFEYTLTPDEFNHEWPYSQAGNRADIKTELGVDLAFYF